MPAMRLLLPLSCIIAAVLSAQQHPDFSGIWHLNSAESDYSDSHAVKPDRLILTVQQKNNALRYRFERQKDGKKGSFDVDLRIGGAPFESDTAGVVTAEWKGAKLQVQTVYNPGQDRQSDQIETWSLSTNGERLTDDLLIHLPNNAGEVHVRRVLDKQR